MLEPTQLISEWEGHRGVKSLVQALAERQAVVSLKGLKGSSVAMVLGAAFRLQRRPMVLVEADMESAAYLYNDLQTILGTADIEFMPSSYQRSMDHERTDSSNILLRTDVLGKVASAQSPMIVVTYPEAVMERVVSPEKLASNTFVISKGDTLSHDFLVELLHDYGFERVDFVYEPGQYSVRGSIIDVFSFADEMPFRLDFFCDDVDSIRTFDIESQLTKDTPDRVTIIPNIHDREMGDVRIPITDFFSDSTVYFFNNLAVAIERINTICTNAAERADAETISQMALNGDQFYKLVATRTYGEWGGKMLDKRGVPIKFDTTVQPVFHKNFDLLAQTLDDYTDRGYRIHILSDNQAQNDRLSSIFKDRGIRTKFVPVLKTLNEGFVDNELKICYFTDHQIFERFHRYNVKTGFNKRESITLAELNNLHIGDYVVHIDHGIGRFGGLQKVEINGKYQESIKLIYRDNDVLFVSIHSLHRISKYKGKDAEVPTVHKLGSGAWQRLKATTKSKVKDIAKDLIKLYAQRKAQKGFAFSPDTFMNQQLEASFMYEDTPDQMKATQAVKADMESTMPMDRLVCGDVGFGKTEVAIRAAFKAVADNKQVAVLVPTTILAMQHYKTFKARLADMPCTVDYLSRLRTAKEQKDILARLESGELNIVIGTHKLIGKSVKFKDLGLLIVDEEQKFGVGVKEKLKQLKVNVDTLTLTATPIPRTLQFSLMGARDLSVISTPPPNRQPILTEVHTFDEGIIKEAVSFELNRGGQVFFINNRIEQLPKIAGMLTRLVPQARVITAHGQMDGNTLEQIMLDFMEGKYDVLVSTTIIESGLDIPNANTIIINDGERYGLSDMHQLRGRVGRSNRKAFCYIFSPPPETLTDEARRRLKAIEDFSELGSGLNLSLQDLDIRGAGNLLGAEQSGFIGDLGFETYQKILDEALVELKESELESEVKSGQADGSPTDTSVFDEIQFVADCHVDTDMELLIPDSYVENVSERINLYRRIDSLQDEAAIAAFVSELTDRFGPVPQSILELLQVVRLRWIAVGLGMERIMLKNGKMTISFVSDQNSVFYQSPQFTTIIGNVQRYRSTCQMQEKNGKLVLSFDGVRTVEKALGLLQKLEEKNS
ncbi:MAG: transcription-repair coupling factor [Salinivirgaceae bacterium]|nr:transcription-repair coupling factor [Salinivirgaceae bacterium]